MEVQKVVYFCPTYARIADCFRLGIMSGGFLEDRDQRRPSELVVLQRVLALANTQVEDRNLVEPFEGWEQVRPSRI